MQYTLTSTSRMDGTIVIILKGFLTIHNSTALYIKLKEHINSEQKGVLIQAEEVEEIDLSFLQCMLALSKNMQAQHKTFNLQLALSPDQQRLLECAGFSLSTFNIRP